jgi:hypothetical protein
MFDALAAALVATWFVAGTWLVIGSVLKRHS